MTAKTGIQTLLKFSAVGGNIRMTIPSAGATPIVKNLHVTVPHILRWGNTDGTVDRGRCNGVHRNIFRVYGWPENPECRKNEKGQYGKKNSLISIHHHHPPLRNLP